MKKNLLSIFAWIVMAALTGFSPRRLRVGFFTCVCLLVLSGSALATDITISATTIPNSRFNLPDDVTGSSMTVTNASTTATLTAANGARKEWAGRSGLRIAIAGVDYNASSVSWNNATSTLTFTLSTAYAASTGSATWRVYSHALLRIFARASFQPNGATYIVQTGAPDRGNWFAQYACAQINGTLYLPTASLPATTDSSDPYATFGAYFFRPDGSLIKGYDCFTQFSVSAGNVSTSWVALCVAPPSPVVSDRSVYTRSQVDSLIAEICGSTCTSYTLGNTTSSSSDISLLFSSDTNKPGFRIHSGHMQYSDDGLTWANVNQTVSTFSLNSQTGAVTFAIGTANNDVTLTSAAGTITLDFPTASGTKRGALSTADWTTFNTVINKVNGSGNGVANYFAKWTNSTTVTVSALWSESANITQSVFSGINPNRLDHQSYGNLSQIAVIRGNGTSASPTVVLSGETIGHFAFGGQKSTTPGDYAMQAYLQGVATENWSGTQTGARINVFVNPTATLGPVKAATFESDSSFKLWGTTSGYIGLSVSAAAGSVNFRLPNADGTSGQAITTDGSGHLSFTSITGAISGLSTGKVPKAASATSLTDSIITESSSKIGINQGSPAFLLTNYTGAPTDAQSYTAVAASSLVWDHTAAGYVATLRNQSNSTGAGGLLINTTNTNVYSNPFIVRIGSNNVFAVTGSSHVRLGSAVSSDLNTADTTDFWVQSSGSTSSTWAAKFENNSSTILAVRNDGRVGIMTSAPSYPLHVVGNGAMKHLIGVANAPSGAIGTSCTGTSGNGASVSVSGTDMAGEITLVTASSGTGGSATCATITFNAAYGAAPHVILTPADSATAALSGNAAFFVNRADVLTTAFTIKVGSSTPATSATYRFTFLIVE